ncbi:MAG: hypothetical protein ACE5H8_06425 [Alphaproteobacteria bacterium]
MADDPNDGPVFTKEMGISHADFFRILPKALGASDYRIEGDRIRLGDADRHLDITLAAEGVRRIASITLPVTRVTLAFHGYAPAEVAATLERFDLYYRRGGG